jgi:hypothetical protein
LLSLADSNTQRPELMLQYLANSLVDYMKAIEIDSALAKEFKNARQNAARRLSPKNFIDAIMTLLPSLQIALLELSLNKNSWLGQCFADGPAFLSKAKERLAEFKDFTILPSKYKCGIFKVDPETYLQKQNPQDNTSEEMFRQSL